jgi:alpha-mannosidase
MLNRLIALFPCQSLESFDLDRREEDAEQLLSGWTALWHPRLLAAADGIPSWSPATDPPDEPAGHLVTVPDCCLGSLPEDWIAQAEAEGACVLRGLSSRQEIIAATIKRLGTDHPDLDPDLVADFLALGYGYLQVELLTRKYRYMSNLNESSVRTSTLAAAAKALAGDAAGARQDLQAAFDRLQEAREYLYPLEAQLFDLTLVAPTTLGQSLRTDLAAAAPCNLLVSGSLIEEMARREPETLDALKQSLAAGSAAIVGGELTELPLPLLDPESIADNLARGLAAYREHLSHSPVVFGRRRFGLTPALPQIIERLGFTAAFHCTLDDGRFPTDSQSRVQWEGIDGTSIESLGCIPIDASRAAPFLALPKRLSDAMSLDRTPAVMFAHWPGKSCCWYDDLRRIAGYGSALGKFHTLTSCFDETSSVGKRAHYQPDQYRSPYLKQDVAAGQPNPISRSVQFLSRRAEIEAIQTLDALASLCGNKNTEASIDKTQSLAAFAHSITGVTASSTRGTLAVNPLSFPQHAVAGSPSPPSPLPSPLEVPSLGFAWFEPNASPPPAPRRKGWFGHQKPAEPPLAEQNLLRNDFCEIRFDPTTGAILSISDYHTRGVRLAQQIALRTPCGDQAEAEANYSTMAADKIVVTSAGPLLGEIVSRGRLLDRSGRRAAGFQQTTRVWRGSRVIELLIELDVQQQPGSNPWDSYYAARFAWKDETATIHRGVSLANMPTDLTSIESPHFLEINSAKQRTTLLCGGLPYHRRIGVRKLDTLLVVQGETARSFRLGIGIDVPNSSAAAVGFLSPPLILPDQPPPPTPSGWLFHLDCRNVMATHWDANLPGTANSRGPTARGEPPTTPGFRVRLQETEGRAVTLGLRCFRPIAAAKRLNTGDVPPVELTVHGDKIEVPIGRYRWIEVEAEFQPT